MPQRTHTVKYGNTERECFSKIHEPLDIPYLIELQKESYKQFITTGIQEVLDDFSPVCDRGGRFELHYLDSDLPTRSSTRSRNAKTAIRLMPERSA